MTTNADKPFNSVVGNTCERERAFTLTDLLVVLATVAILAALILPALAKSGDNGMRMVCLNNLRQFGNGPEHVHRRESGHHALAKLGR